MAIEKIDIAYNNFQKIIDEVKNYSDSLFTEQDARLKVIDRILVDVLEWPFSSILTEPHAGNGYIDYLMKIGDSNRFILEAKRDSKEFGFDKNYTARAFKLNGPVFKDKATKDGIDQAIIYCARKGAELACLSNGRQWVVFKGNRLGDGKEITDGYGFTFHSLESILNNFKLFYDLLSYSAVQDFRFRELFQVAEGIIIRTKLFKKTLFEENQIKPLKRGDYAPDFEKVMNLLFKRLSGNEDQEFVKKCFVHSEQSQLAQAKLEKISLDLINSVQKIKSKEGEELSQIIEQVKESQKNAFVIIVGGKGSGKSTFIDIFFEDVLVKKLREDCIVIKVDLKQSDGDEARIISWLNTKLLKKAEYTVFNGAPTSDELQGMYYDEYQRRRNAFSVLYNQDKGQFKTDFANHIENLRSKQPFDYIKRIISRITKSRKKIPCIIFDNTDHFSIEFQEKVVQYAMSIYEEEISLIIMPITDKTSWQMSKQGALQSFEDIEVLYLPTPSPKKIIEKRIHFLQTKVENTGVDQSQYILGSSIKLSFKDLKGFVYCLQSIFVKNKKVSTWIGNLGNLDIRRCLKITRNLISSPHLELSDLIKIYISAQNLYEIKEYKILNGLIKDKYNLYPIEQHEFIQNIYSLREDIDTSPLLTIRILQLLIDNQNKYSSLDSYITVSQVLGYFAGMGIEGRTILPYLDIMLKSGLCYSYDPTILDIEHVKSIEISPNGKQHYYWALHDESYIQAMIDITPILDDETYRILHEARFSKKIDWRVKIFEFIKYILGQDSLFVTIPNSSSYKGQNKINVILKRRLSKLDL
jgi:hypothetical protein